MNYATSEQRLLAAAPSMLTVLQAVFNELRGLEDVYDGPDGQQMPNTAMCLLNQFGDKMQSVIESATGEKA